MTPAPTFGDEELGQWSIGSDVRAYWWVPLDPVHPRLGKREINCPCKVVRVFKEQLYGEPDETWLVEVTFGTILDELHPRTFRAEQIRAEGSSCGA